MTLPHLYSSDIEYISSEQEVFSGRILVVTSCTKDKNIPPGLLPQELLSYKELWDDRDDDRVARDFGKLEAYRIPAGQLYRGRQHQQLMQGVEMLRQRFGKSIIDVKIISAGFGVVDEAQLIPPYNATFTELSSSKILPIANQLGIPQSINMLMNEPYDCAFFLLGENYLFSLNLPFKNNPSFPCLFLSGPVTRNKIPRHPHYGFVRIGQDDAVSFSYSLVALKGYLFKLFAEQILNPLLSTPPVAIDLDTTKSERMRMFLANPVPQRFLDMLSPFRKKEQTKSSQVSAKQNALFDIAAHFVIPRAKNYGRPMRFYIPDWDDLVDPGYNFEMDKGTSEKRRYDDEVYAHQIYEEPNYDGLLFSKGVVEGGPVKIARIKEMGIHRFAKFLDMPIFGDCGAFSYIASEVPPYETQEILDYYQNTGFNYGVSIDHLIIPAFHSVKEFRYELTQKNAREFLELHRAGDYTFTPVGVAQGWSPETYRNAVIELLELGYQYVALGGLAREQTKPLYEIMREIAPILREDTDLHLFGIARDKIGNEMQIFREMGVTSFDSASYLRRAWLGSNQNYYTEDGNRYIALRISPVHQSSSRVKKILSEGIATIEQLKKLEQDALKAVREFDRGSLDLETTLEVLLEIDRLEEYNYESHKVLYRKVLEDQPWKKCHCKICQEIGVEVIIFRGNDRNRRRGFHNTYVFYQRFRKLIGS